MPKLTRIKLEGFRSIKEMTLELRPLNVLIGANGAGKSNLIAFFKLVNELMGGRLQQHIGATGRATGNLHFGPGTTPHLEAEMVFEVENGTDTYSMRLFYAAGDSLIFAEEAFFPANRLSEPQGRVPGEWSSGNAGWRRGRKGRTHGKNAQAFAESLSRLSLPRYIADFEGAAVLLRRRQPLAHARCGESGGDTVCAQVLQRKVYRRIVSTIRQVAPFFEDFDLEPTDSKDIILNWRHRESDLVFGPHQLSDGTLRAICLISLLLQPGENFPYLIVVDEPELGLHPYALNVIASLFRVASHHTQVLVSTQSSAFLDSFEPEDIVVVERNNEATECLTDRMLKSSTTGWRTTRLGKFGSKTSSVEGRIDRPGEHPVQMSSLQGVD